MSTMGYQRIADQLTGYATAEIAKALAGRGADRSAWSSGYGPRFIGVPTNDAEAYIRAAGLVAVAGRAVGGSTGKKLGQAAQYGLTSGRGLIGGPNWSMNRGQVATTLSNASRFLQKSAPSNSTASYIAGQLATLASGSASAQVGVRQSAPAVIDTTAVTTAMTESAPMNATPSTGRFAMMLPTAVRPYSLFVGIGLASLAFFVLIGGLFGKRKAA